MRTSFYLIFNVTFVSQLCHFPLFDIRNIRLPQYTPIISGLNKPKWSQVTPLVMELHWLPGAAIIQFKSLMLTYWLPAGSAPSYFNILDGGHIGDLLCSTHEHHQTKPPANVLNRGTTCWPLSEQERPPDLRQNSLQRALALLTAFLILLLSLLSSSLPFIILFTHFYS